MKYISHKDIDLRKWDRAVLSDQHPLVFALSFYLDACSPGWDALVKGDYETVMPLTANKKLGISYVLQPPFTPQLGVFGKRDLTFEDQAIDYLKNNYSYVSVEFNSQMNRLNEFGMKKTFILNSVSELKLNSNTKRNIIKATKSELKVNLISGDERMKRSNEFLIPFMKKKLKLKTKELRTFNDLLACADRENALTTFVVKDINSKIMAIAHFVFKGAHAVYLKGTTVGKDTGAMHLLMEHAILYFFKKKAVQFDFGGGQIESLARFYAGFGAHPLTYYTCRFNNLPKPISWLKRK